MLWWMWGCIYLFKLVFFFSLEKSPKVELLDYTGVLLSTFRNCTLFYSDCTNLHSHQQCTRVLFSSHPCQHLLFVVFLVMAVLTSRRCYSHYGFGLHFLMGRDAEHLFRVCWPSVCRLWRSVYSGSLLIFHFSLPIFESGCLFFVDLYDIFVYFGY